MTILLLPKFVGNPTRTKVRSSRFGLFLFVLKILPYLPQNVADLNVMLGLPVYVILKFERLRSSRIEF